MKANEWPDGGPLVADLPGFEKDAGEKIVGLIARHREHVACPCRGFRIPIHCSPHDEDCPLKRPLNPGPDLLDMEPTTISLLGCRGTGKTTTMRAVLRQLAHDEKEGKSVTLLTPILDPEIIRPEKDALSWVMAGLGEYVDRLEREGTVRCHDKLADAYRQLVRKHDSTRPDYIKNLARVTSTADEYAQELDDTARSSVSFSKQFKEFIALLLCAIRDSRRGNGTPLLVVSFDDLDLAPEAVSSVLEAVRHCLVSPFVVVLVSGDQKLLEAALAQEVRKSLDSSNLGSDELARLVNDKVRKLLPEGLRVRMRDLTLAERVDVLRGRLPKPDPNTRGENALDVPLPSDRRKLVHEETIEDLFCHDLLISGNRGYESVRFPSFYSRMLPPSIRGTCHLRDALLGWAQHPNGGAQSLGREPDDRWKPRRMKEFLDLFVAYEPSLEQRDLFQSMIQLEPSVNEEASADGRPHEADGDGQMLVFDFAADNLIHVPMVDPHWEFKELPRGAECGRVGFALAHRLRVRRIRDRAPVDVLTPLLATLLAFTTEIDRLKVRPSVRTQRLRTPGQWTGFLVALEQGSDRLAIFPLLYLLPAPDFPTYSEWSRFVAVWDRKARGELIDAAASSDVLVRFLGVYKDLVETTLARLGYLRADLAAQPGTLSIDDVWQPHFRQFLEGPPRAFGMRTSETSQAARNHAAYFIDLARLLDDSARHEGGFDELITMASESAERITEGPDKRKLQMECHRAVVERLIRLRAQGYDEASTAPLSKLAKDIDAKLKATDVEVGQNAS